MRVLYVPGFMGSSLCFDPGGSEVYYPSLAAIASNGPLTSALAPDGDKPLSVGGKLLFPGTALNDQLLESLLIEQLPAGSVFSSFAWDWRKDLAIAASNLYARIVNGFTPANPVNIVAHSAGGLVAVIAAQTAFNNGNSNLIRRIVCLGTPFQGSYVPEQALEGDGGQALGSLVSASAAQAVTTLSFLAASTFRSLLFSWRGMLQLLPFVKGAWSVGDPQRPTLYQLATYPDISTDYASAGLTSALLFQRAVASALAVTSSAGLLVLGLGTGTATVDRIPQSPARVPPGPFLGTEDGDGVVVRQSSELTTELRYVSTWTHSQLVANFAASGALASALLLDATAAKVTVEVDVEALPMTLVPLTNVTLITLLNQTHRFRELFTVVGFTGQNPATPYIFTMDRSARRAHRFARVIAGDVGGVYLFNGSAWFYVPHPKQKTFFT